MGYTAKMCSPWVRYHGTAKSKEEYCNDPGTVGNCDILKSQKVTGVATAGEEQACLSWCESKGFQFCSFDYSASRANNRCCLGSPSCNTYKVAPDFRDYKIFRQVQNPSKTIGNGGYHFSGTNAVCDYGQDVSQADCLGAVKTLVEAMGKKFSVTTLDIKPKGGPGGCSAYTAGDNHAQFKGSTSGAGNGDFTRVCTGEKPFGLGLGVNPKLAPVVGGNNRKGFTCSVKDQLYGHGIKPVWMEHSSRVWSPANSKQTRLFGSGSIFENINSGTLEKCKRRCVMTPGCVVINFSPGNKCDGYAAGFGEWKKTSNIKSWQLFRPSVTHDEHPITGHASSSDPTAPASNALIANKISGVSLKVGSNPWWQLDMGSTVRVSKIQFKNAVSDCGARLFTGIVCTALPTKDYIGEDEGAVFGVSDTPCENGECGGPICPRLTNPIPRQHTISTVTATDPSHYTIDCRGARGRYVYVQLPGGERLLNFNEFYVFSKENSNCKAWRCLPENPLSLTSRFAYMRRTSTGGVECQKNGNDCVWYPTQDRCTIARRPAAPGEGLALKKTCTRFKASIEGGKSFKFLLDGKTSYTVDTCEQACIKNGGCNAFTHVSNRCWLMAIDQPLPRASTEAGKTFGVCSGGCSSARSDIGRCEISEPVCSTGYSRNWAQELQNPSSLDYPGVLCYSGLRATADVMNKESCQQFCLQCAGSIPGGNLGAFSYSASGCRCYSQQQNQQISVTGKGWTTCHLD